MAPIVPQVPISPRYVYPEMADKPIDQQIAALYQNVDNIYTALNGITGGGPTFPLYDASSSFTFMVFDP